MAWSRKGPYGVCSMEPMGHKLALPVGNSPGLHRPSQGLFTGGYRTSPVFACVCTIPYICA